MHIVFLDQETVEYTQGELDYSQLERLGQITIYPNTTTPEIIERAQDANVLILNKVLLSRDILSQLKHVKLIAVTATGYDCIDVKAAKEFGIAVANVPAYSTKSVAQLTITLLLALASNLTKHVQDTRAKQWSNSERFRHSMFEVQGKTLGIIGLGTIGKEVALLGRALGMHVIATTRKSDSDFPIVDLNTLAQSSDVVSIHCALVPTTKHMINKNFFELMKSTSFLINTARGAIVDELALIDALINKSIAGAGLDVLTQEPPDSTNPLLSMDNVIVTPHVAWAPQETRQRLLEEVAKNISSFTQGNPRNLVT